MYNDLLQKYNIYRVDHKRCHIAYMFKTPPLISIISYTYRSVLFQKHYLSTSFSWIMQNKMTTLDKQEPLRFPYNNEQNDMV